MSRPALEFLRYLLRLRAAETSLTTAESRWLTACARGCRCVVEVGVHEGATSARLAATIAPSGRLWLVDPYFRHTRPERLLGLSFSRLIARRSVQPWADRVRFFPRTSIAAASEIALDHAADLIFIDADHSYPAVRADFLAWAPHLAPTGIIALHDSRRCPARPDLDAATGPVRLVDEILRGDHGPWSPAGEADSIAAFRRRREVDG